MKRSATRMIRLPKTGKVVERTDANVKLAKKQAAEIAAKATKDKEDA